MLVLKINDFCVVVHDYVYVQVIWRIYGSETEALFCRLKFRQQRRQKFTSNLWCLIMKIIE